MYYLFKKYKNTFNFNLLCHQFNVFKYSIDIHIDLHSCVSFSLCVHNFLQFASSALFSRHFNFFCITFSANFKLNILFSSSSPLRNTISFYYCYRFHFTDLEDSFFISILLCVCVPILLYAVCISLLLLVSFLVFICSVCAGHDQ